MYLRIYFNPKIYSFTAFLDLGNLWVHSVQEKANSFLNIRFGELHLLDHEGSVHHHLVESTERVLVWVLLLYRNLVFEDDLLPDLLYLLTNPSIQLSRFKINSLYNSLNHIYIFPIPWLLYWFKQLESLTFLSKVEMNIKAKTRKLTYVKRKATTAKVNVLYKKEKLIYVSNGWNFWSVNWVINTRRFLVVYRIKLISSKSKANNANEKPRK